MPLQWAATTAPPTTTVVQRPGPPRVSATESAARRRRPPQAPAPCRAAARPVEGLGHPRRRGGRGRMRPTPPPAGDAGRRHRQRSKPASWSPSTVTPASTSALRIAATGPTGSAPPRASRALQVSGATRNLYCCQFVGCARCSIRNWTVKPAAGRRAVRNGRVSQHPPRPIRSARSLVR